MYLLMYEYIPCTVDNMQFLNVKNIELSVTIFLNSYYEKHFCVINFNYFIMLSRCS